MKINFIIPLIFALFHIYPKQMEKVCSLFSNSQSEKQLN